jgi:hypothetical protein
MKKNIFFFFFRKFINGSGAFTMSEASISRDDYVRHLVGRVRPALLGHQPASHGLQIHPRRVEVRRNDVQVSQYGMLQIRLG